MTFLTELEKNTNYTFTENGALTNASSLNPVLDYFALAGAMRNNPVESAKLFERAYAADKQLAVRALFYLRDIRGGQGERAVFFAGLEKLKSIDPHVYVEVIHYIPEYGRWSDIFVDGITDDVVNLVISQLGQDQRDMAAGKPVSLLAKWLPSENASSKKSRDLARKLAGAIGYSPRSYRKVVVALRKYIKLLEQQMSAKQWDEIQYDKVPSQAFRKHTKAFAKHDNDRFVSFLTKAEKGEVKLNTSTLFAYEVYHTLKHGQDQAANAMWVNLPDYTNGKNALVIADVSGSMTWTSIGGVMPIDISVSLALYFADRNKGPFAGYFMTFTDNSQLVKVTGKTLRDKFATIERSAWGGSTNIQSAFDAILVAAKTAEASQEEIPSTLYIISDMEFNQATSGNKKTNLEAAEKKFAEAGYKLPHVVFWNVNARNTQVPATIHDNMVTLVSGFSQSTFRYAVEGKSPVEFMLEVLNSERYARIVV